MRISLTLLASALSLAAYAQQPHSFNGTWKAQYTARSGAAREGTVVITDTTGTWDMAVQRSSNPCVGRAYPISVTPLSASEVQIVIHRAKTLPGCKDSAARLRRVNDNTLEGEVDDLSLTLVRQ
jgi:hypothetical protein